MYSGNFSPNVQILQSEVVSLLEQIRSLMLRASATLKSDRTTTEDAYAEFQKEVEKELSKVKNLELVMAIVAPMKAGKSTIVNAIIGQNLLPSRNAAMTTLPTEIILNDAISEPVLVLHPRTVSIIQASLRSLQSLIDQKGLKWAQKKLEQHPHLQELLENIATEIWGAFTHNRTQGREEIVKVLTGLNDLIRLCSLIDPAVDPLRSITDVPQIETPFVRPQLASQSQQMGNLIIVDTPGPNEAGENLRLAGVVASQLQQSSIVLIVLDFTQLKTKASEEIKQEVQKVIELRGKETLYVLVNKVDQRTDEDMTTEQVRQFVAAQFGIGSSGDTDRVFEISARDAFCATNFLLEIQQKATDVSIAEMKTARALAQQSFGALWKRTLEKATVEQMQDAAQEVWELSGFAPFLDRAVNALVESAAPRCMRSALNLCHGRLEQLRDDVKLRRSAMATDAGELQKQIKALEEDLHHLDLCRSRLKQVDTIKKQLRQQLNDVLKNLSGSEPPYDVLKSFDGESTKVFNYQSSAESFQEDAERKITDKVDSLLEEARSETERLLEKSRKDLTLLLERETEPIIERARQRLNQTFKVSLSFPSPSLSSDEIGFARPRRGAVEKKTRYWTESYVDYETTYERRWFSLWLVKHEKVVPVTKSRSKSEDYYVVSKSELISRFKESVRDNVEKVRERIDQYLQEDFQHQISAFFNNLDEYLGSYRDSLRQAQESQKFDSERKQQLMQTLESLVPEADQQIRQTEIYLEQTDKLL